MMRALAIGITILGLAGCGTGRDVRFVVTTEGEARAVELELRVGAETRYFDQADHGQEIVEHAVPEGTRVWLEARNGGDDGKVRLQAFLDDCPVADQSCEGTECTTLVDFTVHDRC